MMPKSYGIYYKYICYCKCINAITYKRQPFFCNHEHSKIGLATMKIYGFALLLLPLLVSGQLRQDGDEVS